MVRILAVGDVFGTPGLEFVRKHLRKIKNAENADLVIVNAENAHEGSGLEKYDADILFESGADVLTGGNHSFRRYAIFDLLEDEPTVLRPLNFPPDSPGEGYCIVPIKNGLRAMVISVCGQVFMDPVDSPFHAVERLLERQKGNYDIAICDFHGEATSEKQAFMHIFDGRIQAVFGTHTHVQTADERLTDRGSGYISDIGMCGSLDSIIGVSYNTAISRFTKNVRMKGIPEKKNIALTGAVFEIDESTLYCTNVKRIKYSEGNLK
ncbi:MAG: TIGR00282 family metallophosphoesterase [Clostridia bacterium]|nr:TIGR00282 family metallophosphoesterase [Clostridia bacterium]